MIGIYKITNMVNGKMYIGQTNDIRRRWKEHRSSIHKANTPLSMAFKKYGLDNFKFEVLEECSEECLNSKERTYIKEFNTYINATNSNGYNMTLGGEGQRGFTHSEETKSKISQSKTGKKLKPMSEEQKKLRSEMFKGKTYTTETLGKMREAKKGIYTGGKHPKAKAVTCDGVEYGCVKECAEHYGLDRKVVANWLNQKHNMPQEFIDMNLRYVGDDSTIYIPQDNKMRPKKVVCNGVVYDNVKQCSTAYGIKDSLMRAWLRGESQMDEQFVKLGLEYCKS